jgi:hypothetical protein
LEDVELESFAQLGDDQYFDEVVELLTFIFDTISELQLECGETMDLVLPTAYSSTFESPDFIAESKWFAPTHMRPRWPIFTLGRNDYFPPPFCYHLMTGLAGYLFLHIDYPNYDHHPFDPGKLVPTILVLQLMSLPSVMGSLVLITSLAEDVKLSTCGRHLLLCFLFYF